MLQRAVTLSRYVVFVAIIAALAASVALILYEAAVVRETWRAPQWLASAPEIGFVLAKTSRLFTRS
jgi:hypothetical protein